LNEIPRSSAVGRLVVFYYDRKYSILKVMVEKNTLCFLETILKMAKRMNVKKKRFWSMPQII
jgi:hypothetical protein